MSRQDKTSVTYAAAPIAERRGGPGSAGQSGDTQGLPDVAEAGSESVKELAEEGQYFEAEVLLGVEAAEDPDIEEVQSSEVADPQSADGTTDRGLRAAKHARIRGGHDQT